MNLSEKNSQQNTFLQNYDIFLDTGVQLDETDKYTFNVIWEIELFLTRADFKKDLKNLSKNLSPEAV